MVARTLTEHKILKLLQCVVVMAGQEGAGMPYVMCVCGVQHAKGT